MRSLLSPNKTRPLIASLIFLSFMLIPLYSFAGTRTLNIIYTGAIGGELEPCGCSPKTTAGGLARLSGYVKANSAQLAPYVIIDAGGALPVDSPQGRLKAEAIARSFKIIGFDAIGLTGKDKGFPVVFLKGLIKKHQMPAVTIGKETKERTEITVRKGPFRINISSRPSAVKKGHINVLVTDEPVDKARTLGAKSWDVIITSSGEELEEPIREGRAIITSGYPKGKKLGILSIEIDDKNDVTSFRHAWKMLDTDVAEDASVRAVLDDYDSKVAELAREEEKKLASSGRYSGAAKCVECHRPFWEVWTSTRHSRAFASLERAGKSKDPECVKCHSTGYGDAGGFAGMTSTPDLANVQCEACHGPAKEHLADYAQPLRPVTEQTCLKCHTKENSPDFDFRTYHEKIKHVQGEMR